MKNLKIIILTFVLSIIGCLNSENKIDPNGENLQGNWYHNNCPCLSGYVWSILIREDSIYSKKMTVSDIPCDTCPCPRFNKYFYSKGKYQIKNDSIFMNNILTDSNYVGIDDSCGYIIPEIYKYRIKNDTLKLILEYFGNEIEIKFKRMQK